MSKSKFGKRLAVGMAIFACAVILAANVHFVYLASTTQPDCIAHKKSGSTTSHGYAAAKSSC